MSEAAPGVHVEMRIPELGRDRFQLFAGRRECELFVWFMLSSYTLRFKNGLDGIYSDLPLHHGTFRRSDRAARIAVCVEALMKVGLPCKEACYFVAEIVAEELGQSRRGRRPARPQGRDLASKVETIRSLWNRYRASQFGSIGPLKLWVDQFRSWKECVFWTDDSDFDFFEGNIEKKHGKQAAKRFRRAIVKCRSMLPPKPTPGDWTWPFYQQMIMRYASFEDRS